jgi:hypothetical protein
MIRGGFEDFEAGAFGKKHLKGVRPGQGGELARLEPDERLLGQGGG